jgi:hypothetical protein
LLIMIFVISSVKSWWRNSEAQSLSTQSFGCLTNPR